MQWKASSVEFPVYEMEKTKIFWNYPLLFVISVEFINTHLIWWNVTQLYSDQSDDGWQTKLTA
jgi:hypothetical protein